MARASRWSALPSCSQKKFGEDLRAAENFRNSPTTNAGSPTTVGPVADLRGEVAAVPADDAVEHAGVGDRGT
jgi:hypothetical protein